jgi:hypothetical protein
MFLHFGGDSFEFVVSLAPTVLGFDLLCFVDGVQLGSLLEVVPEVFDGLEGAVGGAVGMVVLVGLVFLVAGQFVMFFVGAGVEHVEDLLELDGLVGDQC